MTTRVFARAAIKAATKATKNVAAIAGPGLSAPGADLKGAALANLPATREGFLTPTRLGPKIAIAVLG